MTIATVHRALRRPVERPIRTEAEYERANVEMRALADLEPTEGSREYDRLELLTVLIAAYDAENVPDPEPTTPQELVRFMAEQKGLTAGYLAELLGGRSRLSDFMNGIRTLSKGQIIRLRDVLGIPADLLLSK